MRVTLHPGMSPARSIGIRLLGFCFVLAWTLLPGSNTATASEGRDFDVHWSVDVKDVPEGAKDAKVWIAVPQELDEQQVKGLTVDTPYKWTTVQDPDFHNQVVEVTVPNPPASFSVSLGAQVHRLPITGPKAATLTDADRKLYLRKEALVSLSPRMHAIADSLPNNARARYDYVLGLMTYDKTAPGWGHGDSERACDVKKGNCTDFHSLFMSLSRSEDVPTVFEMGYPTTPDGEVNKVGGYHCWAWFYDAGSKGWVPVDISEADKHPEKAEFFFGHLDADRITFSRGRDVKLPGMKGEPLNYLPAGGYVEVDGKPLDSVSRSLTYSVDGKGGSGNGGE
ncbi:MAG: transglutaminase domain-containing protein [Candidatus Eisenbacteria bacterium]